MKIIIIHTGEPSYLYGLVYGLSRIKNLELYIIGSDRSKNLENLYSNVIFLNFRGSMDPNVSKLEKLLRNIRFYFKTIKFIVFSHIKVIHIQWFNKYFFIESTLLIWIYKIFQKKIIYTAHNVNQAKRDYKNSRLNFFLLKKFYERVDHIIVHNNYSKRELITEFGILEQKISVLRLGINLQVPHKNLSVSNARKLFSISDELKVILFFGGLNKYKGVELLIEAFYRLALTDEKFFLIIAGEVRDNDYHKKIKEMIDKLNLNDKIIFHDHFIKDSDIEKYFLAADCLVLPYRYIYQSGLHVLSYSFGTPVIATDVGSFKEEDIIQGYTGFICNPNNVESLYYTIVQFFKSELYINLSYRRNEIINWANKNYSWEIIGQNTFSIYEKINAK